MSITADLIISFPGPVPGDIWRTFPESVTFFITADTPEQAEKAARYIGDRMNKGDFNMRVVVQGEPKEFEL